MFERTLQEARIAVIGLGYVGLPLAVEFAKAYPVVGFDISAPRIKALEAAAASARDFITDFLSD